MHPVFLEGNDLYSLLNHCISCHYSCVAMFNYLLENRRISPGSHSDHKMHFFHLYGKIFRVFFLFVFLWIYLQFKGCKGGRLGPYLVFHCLCQLKKHKFDFFKCFSCINIPIICFWKMIFSVLCYWKTIASAKHCEPWSVKFYISVQSFQ